MNTSKTPTSKIPTSKIKRSAITGYAAAKVGLKHMSHKTRTLMANKNKKQSAQEKHEQHLGEIVFSVLSQLRGTALKVSQILSMEADILPDSIREKLKNACYRVPPINKALVRKQVIQELGDKPNEVFKGFNLEAFAAASIGQVHRAVTFEDEKAAVKVQYPGISTTIESDLVMIEKLFWTLSKTTSLMPKKKVLDLAMQEMQARLKEELDYHIEADNLRWFESNLDLPGIKIPRVIDSYSSKRILTLEMLDGLHVDEWLATNPSQSQKNQIGQILFDFFWYSVFKLNKINADPHPGNFLFLSDGNLGVLDFGCVRQLGDEFIKNFAEMIPAMIDTYYLQKNPRPLFESYKQLRFINSKTSYEQFKSEIIPYLEPYALWFCQAYQQSHFDFKNKTPCPGRPSHDSNVAMSHLDGMYSEQFCFDRAHLGLMNLLTLIGAEIETDWKKFI